MNHRIEIATIRALDNGKRLKNAAKVSSLVKAMNEGAVIPPIWVVTGMPGKGLVLIDGWHRLQAHKILGRTMIDATLIPWPDYVRACRRVERRCPSNGALAFYMREGS